MIDALDDDFYEARKADLALRVSAKRFAHVEGVVRSAQMLARTYGVDEREARLAALLHDWDKGFDDEGIRARVVDLDMGDMVDPWVVANAPATLHGLTAAVALGREFPEIPRSVLQAVWRHTSGAVDMSPLDMVVYVADAIEDSRQFGRIGELRAMVGTCALEELFVGTYEYWAILLFERRKPIHPDTIKVWNSYAVKHAARKGK